MHLGAATAPEDLTRRRRHLGIQANDKTAWRFCSSHGASKSEFYQFKIEKLFMTKTSAFCRADTETQVGINGTKRILMGLVLAVAVMLPHPDAAAGQAPVDLGAASRFAVLAASEITSVPTSAIKGDVGLSPSARSNITGLTAVEVVGTIFAADDGGAVAVMLTQAQGDLTTAYNDAAGRTLAPVDVANADLGGRTLAPGLYKSSGTLAITGNLTLDAQGDPNAVFIFQIVSSLNTASGSQVILSGGANAANIYWQVGSSATLGTYSVFKGTIMAAQSITINTGATLDGRALAQTAAVTLEANTITNPTLRPTPPSFGPIHRAPDSSVTLVITNTPGLTLTLQTSANLT
ncbi:MAG: ice-binding family protein, partial [Verrucomicrobiota bacterium]